MRIEHIAIWVHDLEVMKSFYSKYFQGKPGKKYHNPIKNFTSYFLSFEGGCRLELMNKPGIETAGGSSLKEVIGITHLAIGVGSNSQVNTLTNNLRKDGYIIIGEPRTTGDGYYESVVLDPEGNRIEITV